MLTAIPNYLAQSTGQVTVITFVTALLTVFVAFTIWGAIRHPSGPGLINLLVLLSVGYVFWTAARWPGVKPSDGPLIGLLTMLVDCARTIWDVIWDFTGLDSLSKRIGTST